MTTVFDKTRNRNVTDTRN